MAATKQDVDRWIATGKKNGATHIVSVCDTWNYEDYPVYVMPDEDVNKIASEYRGKNMQRINEIIDLSGM